MTGDGFKWLMYRYGIDLNKKWRNCFIFFTHEVSVEVLNEGECLTNFSKIPKWVFRMCRNCWTNQRPRNSRNSVEHDQKLIKPEEAHSELAHQMWAWIWWAFSLWASSLWLTFRNAHLNPSSDPPSLIFLTHLPWTKWAPFRRRYFLMHFRE